MTNCESPIERLLYKAFLDYGLLPTTQYEIGRYRVDFAFIEERFVVEADGKKFHSSIRAKLHDRQRDRYLRKRGWIVIRFTGSQIFRNSYKCARYVKRRLRGKK